MRETFALVRKEINSYFTSLVALIFVGVFTLGAELIFFYVEGFWARGIADVRPLFRWLPILLIFLASALTMRQWSEEQQSGTMEMLLILPVRLTQLVIAKFLAVLALIVFALALTLILPIMVSTMGNLDSGPVIGGYVAAVLLAAMYVAIGLFVSSRTDNQLVALIVSVLINGAFYLAGSGTITGEVSNDVADILRTIGSGARFDSIERGVLDIRDLAYYITITVMFLGLNVVSLDSRRWGNGSATYNYRFNVNLGLVLLLVNAMMVNVWLYPQTQARVDLTEGGLYSLSDVTEETLDELAEPLLIRAYLSQDTIPDLAPLIPQLEDTLREYDVVGGDNVTVEFVDPAEDEEAETEAANVYGIVPIPAPVSDRFETSIINFYFDILLVYGDQNTVLNANQLIEVEVFGGDEFEFRLANIEYEVTSSIRNLVSGFQSIDTVLESLSQPAQFQFIYSGDSLPEDYAEAPDLIRGISEDLNIGGQFQLIEVNVDDPEANVDLNQLRQQYSIQPFATDALSTDVFYLHGILTVDEQVAVIRLAPATTETEYRELIEGVLRRFGGGFLPVIGIWAPPTQTVDQFGQPQQTLQVYQGFQQLLGSDYEFRTVDLTKGQVPGTVDMLFVLNPQQMTQTERYTVDQYLMLGGTVFVATSAYQLGLDPFVGWVNIVPLAPSMNDMLAHYGVTVDTRLLKDEQSLQTMNVDSNGTFYQHDAPYFLDLRSNTFSRDSLITSSLQQMVLPLASSLRVDVDGDVRAETLITTTDEAWQSTSTNYAPPPLGGGTFPIDGEQGEYVVAVALTGTFTSYFAPPTDDAPIDPLAPNAVPEGIATSPILESPEGTRLIVLGSGEFLSDLLVPADNGGILVPGSFTADSLPVVSASLFLQNMIDWALADTDLLEIRAAENIPRLLDPLDQDEQQNREIFVYGFTTALLVLFAGTWRVLARLERPMPLELDDAYVVRSSTAADDYRDDDDDDDDHYDDDDDRYDDDDDDDDDHDDDHDDDDRYDDDDDD